MTFNQAEAEFAAWAESEGWSVTKRGWPDFLCFRDGELMAVEVKFSDGLSQQQRDACLVLTTHGISTYVWTPPGPLVPFQMAAQTIDPQDTYQLATENERLRAEVETLRAERSDMKFTVDVAMSAARQEIERLRTDLSYVLRVAEHQQHRSARLRQIFNRYPEMLLGLRPKLRRRAQFDAQFDAIADLEKQQDAA